MFFSGPVGCFGGLGLGSGMWGFWSTEFKGCGSLRAGFWKASSGHVPASALCTPGGFRKKESGALNMQHSKVDLQNLRTTTSTLRPKATAHDTKKSIGSTTLTDETAKPPATC